MDEAYGAHAREHGQTQRDGPSILTAKVCLNPFYQDPRKVNCAPEEWFSETPDRQQTVVEHVGRAIASLGKRLL